MGLKWLECQHCGDSFKQTFLGQAVCQFCMDLERERELERKFRERLKELGDESTHQC